MIPDSDSWPFDDDYYHYSTGVQFTPVKTDVQPLTLSYTVEEPVAVHVFDRKVIIIAKDGEVTEIAI